MAPLARAVFDSWAGDVATLQASLSTIKGDYDEALDTIWMLLAALLVFFMHAGFSMLEAGCVRFKNTMNILAKNLIVVSVGFLCWFFVGYSFAFGVSDDPNPFSGTQNWAMSGLQDTPA